MATGKAGAVKVDLKKEFKTLYQPSAKQPVIVDVPELGFLMVDGHGHPATAPEFQAAMDAIYPVAYTLKFTLKAESPSRDFAVAPPEALWWSDNPKGFLADRPEEWRWTVMVALPDTVTADDVDRAIAAVAAKKDRERPALAKLRYERFREGTAAQILHVGPYAGETATIERLHAFIAEQGYEERGKHHEIYLSDPSRAAPEKLKTVVRQPVQRPGA